MRMPSTMVHTFSQVPRADIPRSSFDRTHGYKTTMFAGNLVPIFVDEALPGDTFNLNMTGFARLSTPIHPIMDNAWFNTFFFAVPIRLIWDNWQKFNGEQTNPGDSTDFLVPQIEAPTGGFVANSLEDYFGLPVGIEGISVSAFWHRAYNLIWNEWFRDQNLQDSVPVNLDDGPDDPADYQLLKRGKRHDYFTSCLPWPQKGESVMIPGFVSSGTPIVADQSAPFPTFTVTGSGSPGGGLSAAVTSGAVSMVNSPTATGQLLWDNPGLTLDVSTSAAATINSLRQAFQVQKLYERDARGGTRYTEILRSHFGVVSPDARLQRPEYLGGGQSPINIQQVPQTSASTFEGVETPQGNMAGYGTSVMTGHGFSRSFTEHCVIIGLVSVRADLSYQQGLNRMWSRRSRFDFYWPALAHIGEQAVLNKEIYCDGTSDDELVWGYQERFGEYRYKPSQITGEFRSSYPQSLDAWHLAQDFVTRPVLNASFIEDNPPFNRIVAVPAEPHFIADFHFNMRCARPMPVFGVPGLVDHF